MDVMIPELELQQELQRFTARFSERIAQCAESLQSSPRADVREEALRKHLQYMSSAIEIATGPSAAVNLLDMFVFLHLGRSVLEHHWIPTLYGDSGAELDQTFTRAEEELVEITLRALGPQGLARLTDIVDKWLAENPGAIRVEGIRLADFAGAAGTAAADRALQARGLLSSMKVATEAANQAMMITERSMFLVHRLPFLWRLHVRLGAREVLDDTLRRLGTGGKVARLARSARRGGYALLIGAAAAAGLKLIRRSMSRRAPKPVGPFGRQA